MLYILAFIKTILGIVGILVLLGVTFMYAINKAIEKSNTR